MFPQTVNRLLRALHTRRPELLIWLTVAAGAAMGLFTGLQGKIDDAMFWATERPASGDIVIVQIDSRSLAAIAAWPWPRSRHAEVLDRLGAAGAELIGFDVDFSSPSHPGEDARLARAIGAADGRVVLPSFVQHATPGEGTEFVETNPLPVLREGSMIGNANVFAPEGVARRGSVGLYLPDGRYRPTFAGLMGQQGHGIISEFDIDFAVDLSTFKRLSFVDVLNGKFDPAIVKGKRVIIGATAVELGDRVPVARHGVIAGVELQALIAESIVQGRMLLPTGPIGALIVAALVLAAVRPSQAEWSFQGFGRRSLATAALIFVGPVGILAVTPLIIETSPALCALAGCFIYVSSREFASRARTVLRERSAAVTRGAVMNLIVEGSSDGIVVSDSHGRIELVNERAAQLLSATRSTLIGRPAANYLPAFESTATGITGERQTEITVECDGGQMTLETSVRRLAMPATAGVATHIDVYTLRDVTTRRRLEDAERRAQEERLMAEQAKSNFIANMSHELRTPLNAIIGFSEMMSAQTYGPLGSPKYTDFCDVVAKSGHHLLALINNVLEISRVDHTGTSVDVDVIDFSELAEPCVQFLRSTRDYKGQTIISHVSADTTLHSDRRLVKLILLNLLSNAIKFTGEHGSVGVTAQTQGEDFVFEVSDDGAGIDPNVMPHLTKLFYQGDNSFARKHEGMGVGLYLVKRYVDLLQGKLAFESEPGKGTTVRVTLPGASARTVTAAAA